MKARIAVICIFGVVWNVLAYSGATTEIDVCAHHADGTTLPVDGDCGSFYYCSGHVSVEMTCSDYMHFDASKDECVDKKLSSCITNKTAIETFKLAGNECTGQPLGAYISYPGDCTKFLVCQWNSGTVFDCPDGLYFNSKLGVCDWPTAAGCTQGSITTTSSTTLSSIRTSSTTTISTTIELSTHINSRSSVSTPGMAPTLPPDDGTCNFQINGSLHPYPYECAWYIKCENDIPTVLPCKDGWLFNSILLICDYPENVDCIASPYPTTTASLETTTDTSSSTLPRTSSSTESITIPPSSSLQPTLLPGDESCSAEEIGTLRPYPYDCAWYIKCNGGTNVVLPCEEGWLFNPILLICDYPECVECIVSPYPTTIPSLPKPVIKTTTISPSTTTASPSPPTSTASSAPPGSVPTIGPEDDICLNQENDHLFPYPYDCAWYIRCKEDNAVILSCQNGWLFNPFLLICDYPESVNCTASPYPTTPIPTTSATSIETTTVIWPTSLKAPSMTTVIVPTPPVKTTSTQALDTEASTTITVPSTPTPPPSSTGICAKYPLNSLIPYPGNCSQYIRCQLPAPITLECSENLEFNAQLQICELPQNAGCSEIPTTIASKSKTTPLPVLEMIGSCRGYQEGDLIPYPGDCSKYIICENPIAIAQHCEFGLQFNSDLVTCDEPKDAGCSANSYTMPPPQNTSYDLNIPGMTGVCSNHHEGDLTTYPGSCTKYIRCEYPVPIAQECQDNLHFNKVLGICDAAESANCPSYSTTTPRSEVTTSSTTPKTPTFSGICHGQDESGMIQYPRNCSKYILCQSPEPIAIACSNGLHFNAELQICDDPTAAGCEQQPITTSTPPDGNVCCGHPIGTLIPYPEDCSQYIQCEYPVPIVLSCEDGYHYSPADEKCEPKAEANCEWYIITTPAPLTCDTQPTGVKLPFEGNCKRYNLCSNGMSIPLPCPRGTVFNQEVGDCIQGTTCPQ